MLDLHNKNIVLLAIGSTKIPETIKAIEYCKQQCTFKDIYYLTDSDIRGYGLEYNHIYIQNIPSIHHYQHFIVNNLPDYIKDINCDFFLTINWDGFIVNTSSWTDDFLLYDYIGAPWPWFNNIVGNGGFCLKSKKFILSQLKICKNYRVKYNEDIELCINLKNVFESYGCNFAPYNIAYKFSVECGEYNKYNSFGFHDFKYHPYFLNLASDIET